MLRQSRSLPKSCTRLNGLIGVAIAAPVVSGSQRGLAKIFPWLGLLRDVVSILVIARIVVATPVVYGSRRGLAKCCPWSRLVRVVIADPFFGALLLIFSHALVIFLADLDLNNNKETQIIVCD